MPTLGYTDNDGIDVGNKYVTKEYIMDWYPDLVTGMKAPQLFTWGYDAYGQLGDGTTVDKSSPITVLNSGGSNSTWKQVATGSLVSAAIKTDGTLWAWGLNSKGQLGDGTTTNRSSPVTTAGGGTNWKQVTCSFGLAQLTATAAIKTDGTLWTWGFNLNGELGTGNTTSRSSPGTTAGGGTNWKQVSCAYSSTAAIKTDGTLWTWGGNVSGQLGTGTTTARSSPGTTAGGGTNWKQVSCGYKFMSAVKTDGTLWTWGNNTKGQLGDGTTTSRSSPGTVAGGGTSWKQVSCGLQSTVTVKTDGTLWTWGDNYIGAIGAGTTTSRSSPGTISGGGTNWKQVSCGYIHAAAISENEGW